MKSLRALIITFALSVLIALVMLPSGPGQVRAENEILPVENAGGTNYSLFNSGLSGGKGKYYNNHGDNPSPASHDNNGYDIYVTTGGIDNSRIGLSFSIDIEVTEKAKLTFYNFDVDESGGEKDAIFLCNETTGGRVKLGYLSGMDDSWSTTSFDIDPSLLVKGNVYHLFIKSEVYGWVVWTRTADLLINGKGGAASTDILSADLSASISHEGKVSVKLDAKASEDGNFRVEYKAVCQSNEAQYGGKEVEVAIPAEGATFNDSFMLDSDAVRGSYRISAFIKRLSGSVITSVDAVVGYDYSAVSYNANGGSQNLPNDCNSYEAGDTVTVKFDYIPSKKCCEFLGWDKDPAAKEPAFVDGGNNEFTIGTEDVTLYAIWQFGHKWDEGKITKEPTCTESGVMIYTCTDCGKTRTMILPELHHDMETITEQEASCVQDGIILKRCRRCGYEERIVIHGEHNYEITDRKEATCTEEGYIEYTCKNCGDKYREVLKASHNYVETARVEPKAGVPGKITYTCTRCGDSYDVEIPPYSAIGKSAAVLLIQDSFPWAEDVNVMLLKELANRGVVSAYNIITSQALEEFDISRYGVVMIANDQRTSMYDRIGNMNAKFEEYVSFGGILIYGACDEGWGGCGSLTTDLPCGIETENYYSVHNYTVDGLHPVVTGVYTDNQPLKDELLKGNYCSHTYFLKDSLPEGADVILMDAHNNPTLVEYGIGDGMVIASGLTWEYFYVREHYGMSVNYSKHAFDDLITYAVRLSDSDRCSHDFGEEGEVHAPTCTENGYTSYKCKLCGYEFRCDIVPALGHSWDEGEVIKEPTCVTEGIIKYICTRCGATKEEAVPVSGHSWDEGEVVKEPTCTEEGTVKYTCTVCGESVTRAGLPALGHDFDNGVVTKEPTCTNSGVMVYTCTRCGKTRTVILSELHHDMEVIVLQEPTCTEDGIILKRCRRCGYEERIIVPGEHNYEVSDYKKPTCTEEGYIEYTCTKCGHKYKEILRAAHNYVETARIEPKAGVPGKITYTCTMCGDSYDIEIPAFTNLGKTAAVLLIQDSFPWAKDVNVMMLNELVYRGVVSAYNIINSSALEGFDLSRYGVVMIANDQTTPMYDRIGSRNAQFEDYVKTGGILIYGACDEGWGGCGSLTANLPAGIETANYYSIHNYTVDGLHPVVTGIYTDGKSLTDELLKGNYCSHTYFLKDSLPEGADAVIMDANGNPTLIEYGIGDGMVIASGLTWEYFYVREHYGMSLNYSKQAFDDLITYAIRLSDGDKCSHDFGEGEVHAPTCTENGYTAYVCRLCGYEFRYDIVPALGHRWDKGEVIKEADCMEEGVIRYTCTACGETREEVIPMSDHSWDEGEIIKEATCTEEGLVIYTCTVCGTTKEEVIPVSGHSWGEGRVIKEATCTEEGIMQYVCTVCGEKKTETISMTEHKYVEIERKKSTCTTKGYVKKRCRVCQKEITETLPLEDHVPGNWIIDKKARRGEPGHRHKECLVCGKVLAEEEIPAREHKKPAAACNGSMDVTNMMLILSAVVSAFIVKGVLKFLR